MSAWHLKLAMLINMDSTAFRATNHPEQGQADLLWLEAELSETPARIFLIFCRRSFFSAVMDAMAGQSQCWELKCFIPAQAAAGQILV